MGLGVVRKRLVRTGRHNYSCALYSVRSSLFHCVVRVAWLMKEILVLNRMQRHRVEV